MTLLVVLTVVVIALLIAGLAIYLFWVGSLLQNVATNLEACDESVQKINKDAELIGPGVEHINRSGATVAGACRCSTASPRRSWRRRAPTGAPGDRGPRERPPPQPPPRGGGLHPALNPPDPVAAKPPSCRPAA
ncbi:hypothetical protein BJF78_36675 [Pseudonocardia sp. CNS-139]|nr:hypothetical protein BJF78_36675 [Pseudonocardia sp. CNS-139]